MLFGLVLFLTMSNLDVREDGRYRLVRMCEGSEKCSGGQLFQKWNQIYPHSYSQRKTFDAKISCEKNHVKKFIRIHPPDP